jgi:hypothetical protein
MSYDEGSGEGWTEASGETYEGGEVPAPPPEPTSTEDDAASGTGEYAAAAYPGDRWDTAPVIEQGVSDAWDWTKQQAEDAWNWATGDDQSGYEGGGGSSGGGGASGSWDDGAEGGPPSYDTGGPSDAGVPGGVPDEAICGEGACPTCSSDRQMSSGCVLQYGHSGEHQCGYGDLFSQGAADIPPPPPLPKCRTVCSVCGQTCMLILGHDGAHGCGH